MNFTELIRDYGYLAIVVGTFFEGEAVMLAAGVAASAGLLSLPGVIVASMAGIFGSDMFCFLLGRFAGQRLSRWFPRMYARLGPVFGLIERHNDKLIVCYQFVPGLCAVTPMAFGMTRVSVLRFMGLGLMGNALWTIVYSFGGFYSAAAIRSTLAGLQGWGGVVYGTIAAAVLAIWLARRQMRNVASVKS